MRKPITLFLTVLCLSANLTSCQAEEKDIDLGQVEQTEKEEEKYLGAMSPEDALEYMMSTPDLLILDVREDEWYEGYSQFEGNVHIPKSKLSSRYKELPTDRSIIINCGAGVVAPQAYKVLQEINPNVRSLAYIAGTPRFTEYNQWLKTKK